MPAGTPPFARILIANRGEIACRIARTARRLGIGTVAVYSEADAGALHVRMADEAVAIGGSAPPESYLVGPRIIQAALDTGAEAVHPGFGFLSENAGFVEAVEAAGLVFIGPGAAAIAAMGDKIESKRLAERAGVPVVPGDAGEIADAEAAVASARRIGYPVMVKASAGGGGKGMRIAGSDGELRQVFGSTVNEAENAFGDGRVFVEKYVEEPRHIEVQVLADAHGNAVHLGERECSIQRRHQKVIEECPSPFVDEALRAEMGARAVALARAVDYRSAGTVEFIVDRERNFYFLEMNTRLQVEHPVTEMVTGLDLVEQMLRVAAGEPLAFGQEDVRLDGWAIEARVYAERPERNFAPSIGRLETFRPPAEEHGVRIDTGVVEGSEITMFYDPMIAKLAAHGATREEARLRLAGALGGFAIGGVGHNIDFLAAIADRPRFAEGRLSTAFIDEEFPEGYDPGSGAALHRRLFAAVATALARAESRAAGGGERRGWAVLFDEDTAQVEARPDGEGLCLEIDGEPARLEGARSPGGTHFEGRFDGGAVSIRVEEDGAGWLLSFRGAQARVRAVPPRVAEFARLMPKKAPPDTSKVLLSPMPGLLVSLAVAEGEEVEAGQTLAVVEAMKMENVLRAERPGRVKSIPTAAGDNLAADQPILYFE